MTAIHLASSAKLVELEPRVDDLAASPCEIWVMHPRLLDCSGEGLAGIDDDESARLGIDVLGDDPLRVAARKG